MKWGHRGTQIALLAIALSLLLTAQAGAATRYAEPGGNGAAPCAFADPCSIENAMNPAEVNDGDEIILFDGTYAVSTQLEVYDSVTVRGATSAASTVINSSSSGYGIVISNPTGVVRDLSINYSGGLGGVLLNPGTLRRARVTATAATACTFGSATITDSICTSSANNNAGLGVSWLGPGTFSAVFRNVTAISTGSGFNADGFQLVGSGAVDINVDAKGLIAVGGTGPGSEDVDVNGFDAGTDLNVSLDHSNFSTVDDTASDGASVSVSAPTSNDNQSDEPVFLNAGTGDYRQAPNSPTIDAGVVDGSSGNYDIDGQNRTQGPAPDIGAYEYMSPSAPNITTPAGGSLTSDTPTVSGTSETTRSITVRVDGNPVGSTTADISGNWSVTSDVLSSGPHSVTATAADGGGNPSVPSAAVNFTVDSTDPVVGINSPVQASLTADNTPVVDFTVTELNPDVSSCSVDGNPAFGCNSGDSLATLADGSHTLEVTHTDDVGNTGSASTTFTVDATAPTVTITSPATGSATRDNTPTFEFSTTDANSGTTTCSIDGAAAACVSGAELAALADGSHSVQVNHTDAVGNVGSATATFSVDTTPPKVKFGKKPKKRTTKRTARITFNSNEPGSTFECKLDRGKFKPCKSPFSTKKLKPGKHKLQVVAIDQLGNKPAKPTALTWNIKTSSK